MIHGDSEKVNAAIRLLSKFEIIETVRTGKVVMARREASNDLKLNNKNLDHCLTSFLLLGDYGIRKIRPAEKDTAGYRQSWLRKADPYSGKVYTSNNLGK